MATRSEPIHLGMQSTALLRVVRDRKDDTAFGIQTGVISHRHEHIPVWRPANPRALGLEPSWRDGHWRNVYQVALTIAPYERDELYLRQPIDAEAASIALPAATLMPTPALERYLRQQR